MFDVSLHSRQRLFWIGRFASTLLGERQELVYLSLGPWPEFRTAQGAMLLVDFSLPLALSLALSAFREVCRFDSVAKWMCATLLSRIIHRIITDPSQGVNKIALPLSRNALACGPRE